MISLGNEIRARKVVEMAYANTLTHSSDVQVEEPVIQEEPTDKVSDLVSKGKESIEKLLKRRSQNEK